MIEPRCDNCAHWDSRDALAGWCEEIAGVLRLLPEVCAEGLAPCRSAAGGRCNLFVPSAEARQEEAAWKTHESDLRRAAGDDYPASLA